jgi:hypothetical protein
MLVELQFWPSSEGLFFVRRFIPEATRAPAQH